MIQKLRELREKIEEEIQYIDLKPYSHNIVSLLLRQIATEFGTEEADKVIRDFELEELGWKQIKEIK